MAGGNILRLENVSKSFGGLKAVNDVNLYVPERHIACLVGPNGAGKTSVFNVITGYYPPDTGEIWLRDKSIKGLPSHRMIYEGIARTFQNLRLFDSLTVLDNVLLGGLHNEGEKVSNLFFRPRKVKESERVSREKAESLLELVGLIDLRNERAGDLPYGKQKLLCIARCLMSDPVLLLLDEVTSGLDPKSLEKMMEVINGFCDKGGSVLMIEHNMQVVREIAHLLIFLHYGHVLAIGNPEEIISDRELTEIYFGEQ